MSEPGNRSESQANRRRERELRRLWQSSNHDCATGLEYARLLQKNGRLAKALGVLADLTVLRLDDEDTSSAIAVLAELDDVMARGPTGIDAPMRRNIAGLAVRIGQACESRQQIDDARRAYLIATRIDGELLAAHNELAALCFRLKEYAEAERGYWHVLTSEPGNVAALTGLAALLSIAGRNDEGLELLTMERASDEPALVLLRARMLANTDATEPAIDLLKDILDDTGVVDEYRASAFVNLGKLYDRIGQYDMAMECFVAGKKLKRSRFNPALHTNLVDTVIDVYGSANLPKLHRTIADPDTAVPVFIVGMPRSGTTLVEQVLAGCDRVCARGERDDLIAAVLSCGGPGIDAGQWPRSMLDIDAAKLAAIATRYQTGCPSQTRVATDKMPPNFMFLGFIWQLFPNARIVHCVRNPLDTALSCFFQDFSAPLFDFCHDIAHLGAYYKQYTRLMRHWRMTLEMPMLDLAYEDLVTEPEAMGRTLFEFVGLEWDKAYLDVSAVNRVINTASHAQVTQPIYASSVGRHKHYAAYLQPFMQAGFG